MNREMRNLYEKLLFDLKRLETEADAVLEEYNKMSPKGTEAYADELKIYLLIQNKLMNDLQENVEKINYLLKEPKEGHLEYLPDIGRYTLDCMGKGVGLSCGFPIEILNKKWKSGCDDYRWFSGRIEYSEEYGGYYFFNNDGENISLEIGMKMRIR